MSLGMAGGLASVYCPSAFAQAARRIEGLQFVAAATAGRPATAIKAVLRQSPAE